MEISYNIILLLLEKEMQIQGPLYFIQRESKFVLHLFLLVWWIYLWSLMMIFLYVQEWMMDIRWMHGTRKPTLVEYEYLICMRLYYVC